VEVALGYARVIAIYLLESEDGIMSEVLFNRRFAWEKYRESLDVKFWWMEVFWYPVTERETAIEEIMMTCQDVR
jgi:hypothetical protein